MAHRDVWPRSTPEPGRGLTPEAILLIAKRTHRDQSAQTQSYIHGHMLMHPWEHTLKGSI